MVFCGYGVVIFVIFYRKVTIHFDFPNGSRKTVEAKVGTNILDVVLDYDVDIDGFGMCSIFIVHKCLYTSVINLSSSQMYGLNLIAKQIISVLMVF